MKIKTMMQQNGFTLIEYIVALVIAAIVAAMVYTYMGDSLIQSSAPIFRLQKASNLRQVMENIVADYNRLNALNLRYKWRSGTAYSVGAVVLPSNGIDNATSTINNNARYYLCTQAGTSSSSTLPAWPAVTAATTTLGRTVNDGSVVWLEKGYVWKASQTYPANSIVVPVISNGHYYRGGGTSGTTDPKNVSGGWPKTNSATVSDGAITWTEVGTILDRSNTGLTDSILLDSIKYYLDNTPGRYDPNNTGYTVVAAQTKFIKFSSTGSEEDATGTDEKNILKVTIKNNDSAETLTGLFTIR